MILDLYGCDPATFTRESITEWLKQLCELIDMQREDLHFWDYEGFPEEKAKAPDHLQGTSVVQFITTSDVVGHLLDVLKEGYINIFTCKEFDDKLAADFTATWFGTDDYDSQLIIRGKRSKCKL